MKKINLLWMLIFLLLSLGKGLAQQLHLVTPNTSLVLSAQEGDELKFLYFGNKMADVDRNNLWEATSSTHAAYPVYGLNCPSESALAVVHADGNMTLQLIVDKVTMTEDDVATIAKITLKDKVYPFYVNVCYKAYKQVDIIEIWTEISHAEKKECDFEPFCIGLSAFTQGGCMAFSSLWFMG